MKVRVLARFKNANLAEIIEEQGFKTQKAFAEAHGFDQSTVGDFLNFQRYPKSKAMIDRIEKATKRPLDDLFPLEYRNAVDAGKGRPIQKTFDVLELPESFQPKYLLESPIDMFERKELREKVLPSLLRPKEVKVLTETFGLDGEGERTYEDVGKELGVSRERIRQIQARALRKLKHPSRSRTMRGY